MRRESLVSYYENYLTFKLILVQNGTLILLLANEKHSTKEYYTQYCKNYKLKPEIHQNIRIETAILRKENDDLKVWKYKMFHYG